MISHKTDTHFAVMFLFLLSVLIYKFIRAIYSCYLYLLKRQCTTHAHILIAMNIFHCCFVLFAFHKHAYPTERIYKLNYEAETDNIQKSIGLYVCVCVYQKVVDRANFVCVCFF